MTQFKGLTKRTDELVKKRLQTGWVFTGNRLSAGFAIKAMASPILTGTASRGPAQASCHVQPPPKRLNIKSEIDHLARTASR